MKKKISNSTFGSLNLHVVWSKKVYGDENLGISKLAFLLPEMAVINKIVKLLKCRPKWYHNPAHFTLVIMKSVDLT